MELNSPSGESLRVDIVGYQFPELETEDYDSNWLRIRVSVSSTRGRWTSVDPSLLTYEVAALADWLDKVSSGEPHQEDLHFVEPNLSVCILPNDNLRVYFELECRPPWAPSNAAPAEDIWLEFPLDYGMLREAAGDLREQLRRYPQRAAL